MSHHHSRCFFYLVVSQALLEETPSLVVHAEATDNADSFDTLERLPSRRQHGSVSAYTCLDRSGVTRKSASALTFP